MEIKNKLLLIGGTGQNVGKTTFICNAINHFADKHKIVAIKTSNHFHGILDTDIVLANNDKYIIVKETVTNTGKDSARMLESGADEVFFIQSKDENIFEAFSFLEERIDSVSYIICESASLRSYIQPAVFIALKSTDNKEIPSNKSNLELADIFISNYLAKVKNIDTFVEIGQNGWITTKQNI